MEENAEIKLMLPDHQTSPLRAAVVAPEIFFLGGIYPYFFHGLSLKFLGELRGPSSSKTAVFNWLQLMTNSFKSEENKSLLQC